MSKGSNIKRALKTLKTELPGQTYEQIQQEISKACVEIGDLQYSTRENDRINELYAKKQQELFVKIDGLRNKLGELEKAGNGPKKSK